MINRNPVNPSILVLTINSASSLKTRREEKGAWELKHKWSDKNADGKTYAEAYSDYYKDRVKKAVENGEKADCMDFQVSVLAEYASEKGLALSFSKSDGSVINMAKYDSFEDFLTAAKTLSAKELIYNTEVVSYSERREGYMRELTQINKEGVRIYHVVGYTGLNSLAYGSLDKLNNPTKIITTSEYTVLSKYMRNGSRNIDIIIGVNKNGSFKYDNSLTSHVLRWNFSKIGGE